MHRENIFDLFNQQQAEAAKAAQPAEVVTPAQVRSEEDIVKPDPDKQEPAAKQAEPAPKPAEPAQPADNPAENTQEGGEANV